MQIVHYLQINIIAIVILLIIYLNITRRREKYLFEQKLFLAIMGCNAIILVFDTLMWVLNGQRGFLFREFNLFSTFFYYILNPIPCLLWALYADYQIFRDMKHIRKLILPFAIPALVNLVLSISSIFYNVLFYIDERNVYHRGQLFLVMAAICYGYLFYTFIKIIKNKNQIQKRDYYPLLFFGILPFSGGIIQVLFYGVSLIWSLMALAILMIFINIQNNQLYTDHLTGLYNRRQLDHYLIEYLRNNANHKRLLAGLMLDINSFKKINDIYGHAMGDQALEHTAEILKDSVGKDDFIARYGGDEFVIVFEVDQKEQLSDIANRIKSNVTAFNEKKTVPYQLGVSMGYDIFDYQSHRTIDRFLSHIDALMYENKKSRGSEDGTV